MPWNFLRSARVSARLDPWGAVAVPAFGFWLPPKPSVTKACTLVTASYYPCCADRHLPCMTSISGRSGEFNFGGGVGAMRSTEHLIVTCIVGQRFSWPHRPGAKLKTSHE